MTDKNFIIFLGIALILSGITLLWVGVTIEIKKILPPGYSLLCNNNGKYKWSGGGYHQSRSVSKQDAINYAWSNYKEGEFVNCDDHL